jgi:hypothetical protein
MYGHDKFCQTLDKHLISAKDCANCFRANNIREDERKKIIHQIRQIDWSIPFDGHGGFYVDNYGRSWVNQSLVIGIVESHGPR